MGYEHVNRQEKPLINPAAQSEAGRSPARTPAEVTGPSGVCRALGRGRAGVSTSQLEANQAPRQLQSPRSEQENVERQSRGPLC